MIHLGLRPTRPLRAGLHNGAVLRTAGTPSTDGHRRTAVPPYRLTLPMPDDNSLQITPDLRLPLTELDYQVSRSGGPGGQHVNTSSTRVEVRWDISGSPSLTPEQRAQLLERLKSRLDSTGGLRLVSSGTRSQLRNREDVTERLREVVAAALAVRKKRKPTKPSRSAKAARLESKRRRASTKLHRRPPVSED
jgi:ribosome-associated protein